MSLADFSSKKVLVVGASGFLGRNLVESLVARKAQVTGLSRSATTAPSEIHDYIESDLSDDKTLAGALNNKHFDVVFNCSTPVANTSSFDDEKALIDLHLLGVRNLVGALYSELPDSVFIHTGSAKEYGDCNEPCSENRVPASNDPYGFAKFAATEYLRMRSRLLGFPLSVCRPFLIYGKEMSPGLIQYCVQQAEKNEELLLAKPLYQLDLIHVQDVVEGLLSSMDVASVGGCICNLGSAVPCRVRDVAQLICEHTGKGRVAAQNGDLIQGMLVAAQERCLLEYGWSPVHQFSSDLDEICSRGDM